MPDESSANSNRSRKRIRRCLMLVGVVSTFVVLRILGGDSLRRSSSATPLVAEESITQDPSAGLTAARVKRSPAEAPRTATHSPRFATSVAPFRTGTSTRPRRYVFRTSWRFV